MLRQRLENYHAYESKLQESLAHLEEDLVAKDNESSELCTTIAHMREHEVCFPVPILNHPATLVLYHGKDRMHDQQQQD